MKCYKIVFKVESLRKNYAFFLFIFQLIFYILILILFYCKFYDILINTIKKIQKAKKSLFNYTKTTNNYLENNDKKTSIKSKRYKNNEYIKLKINKINDELFPPKRRKGRNKKNKGYINNNINDLLNTKKSIINEFNTKDRGNHIIQKNNKIPNYINNYNYKKYEDILKYSNNELNSLNYENALKIDKRTCFEYYISLLKNGNLLIFAFYILNNDYNSQILKIYLFFFSFSVNLTINALFFNDDTMNKIYIDEGSFNFIYQIPQIIYSSVISNIIDIIIKYLSLSENEVIKIKMEKKLKSLDLKFKKLFQILKIKFALFFIVSFLFLLSFGYYNICFCGIYVNTQFHLIIDSLIGFGLSFVYPFGIYIFPGILRIKALHAKKQDKEYIYKFSQFIQDI